MSTDRAACDWLRHKLNLDWLDWDAGEDCQDKLRACKRACDQGKREWGLVGGARGKEPKDGRS